MYKSAIVLPLCLMAACSTATVTPHYDLKFGEAVREAKHKMTIDPAAGEKIEPVAGMDGKAARDSIILYQKTFQAPPPVVNVINIGGAIGSGGN